MKDAGEGTIHCAPTGSNKNIKKDSPLQSIFRWYI